MPASSSISYLNSRLGHSRDRPFQKPSSLLKATLMYACIPSLEHVVDQHSIKDVMAVANLFTSVVNSALRETGGQHHSLEHNACFVSWNILASCSLHAQSACHAAIHMRDQFDAQAQKEQLVARDLSIGIWTGQVLSGSFGCEGLKGYSCLGLGVSRVKQLQSYAAFAKVSIIANEAARFQLAAAPTCRLVAVDVLAPPSMDQYVSVKQSTKQDPSEDGMSQVGSSASVHQAWNQDYSDTTPAPPFPGADVHGADDWPAEGMIKSATASDVTPSIDSPPVKLVSSEVVHQVICMHTVAEDEWMYQLSHTKNTHEKDQVIAKMFNQLRLGKIDQTYFDRELAAIEGSTGDPVLIKSCICIRNILRNHAIDAPYARKLRAMWSPDCID